ncbi:retention module-containing protein [Marinobacterium sp. D7]|uniref:retention module-containing protein n=1 Tax=Marinobacterium ramblicola TaxID=2849041 RepID=UPI001C2DD57F|nr:retention module-containing protein [Marinobacterium ramblicola]MBV1788497.1 retention module-containing protein [Marinobacterium ramblicola]
MTDVIGRVSAIRGQAVAVAADGSERVLLLGDQVIDTDLIRTGTDSQVDIRLEGGEVVHLNSGVEWLVSGDPGRVEVLERSDQAAFEVDAIQAAILAGEDPTAVAQAPAAGGDTSATGNEGAEFVVLDRVAGEVTPEAGYATRGIGYSVEQPESEEPILVAATVPMPSEAPEPPRPPEPPQPPEPPEPPAPLIADYRGYAAGQGSDTNPHGTGGTYADANGLKDTGAENAWALYNAESGYYSVGRVGNPQGETDEHIDPNEALAFKLSTPMTEVYFHFDGDVGGSQWSIYSADGERITLANNEKSFSLDEYVDESGLGHFYLNDAGGEPLQFQYIAFDGGDDAQFSVKPLEFDAVQSGEYLGGSELFMVQSADAPVVDPNGHEDVRVDLSDVLDGANSSDLAALTGYIHVAEDSDNGGLLLSLNHQGAGIEAGIDQVISVDTLSLSDLGLDMGMDQTDILSSLLDNGIIYVD